MDIFANNKDMDEVRKDLIRMWEGTWITLEKKNRFSENSKNAFTMLKNLTKHHMFDKSGGGIAGAR